LPNRRIERPVYAFNKVAQDEDVTEGILVAPMPERPINRCIAGTSVHLPFYRQIQRYKREKVVLKASTINGWFVQVCLLLVSLYEALKKEVLQTNYLQADESSLKVQITQLIAFFEYQTSRRKEHPLNTLKDFKGHLQTDDYGGYDCFDKHPNYISVKCMSHARRKFEKALKENKPVAALFMVKFQQLYLIEEQLRENRPADQTQEAFYV